MKTAINFWSRRQIQTIMNIVLICMSQGLFLEANAQQILPEDAVDGSGLDALRQEVDIFSTIQNGAMLSVAECELFDECNANVNKGEIEQLLDVVDSRINLLSSRFSSAGETELEAILIGYVDVRDGYTEILDKIETLPQFEHQLETNDVLQEEFFGSETGEVPDDLLRLFMDADEDLVDDEVSIEDEL